MKSNKINVLEFFYEYVTEDDWLDGLDSYQAAKVSNVKNYDGLITGTVLGTAYKKLEVRLKIHPNAKCVQWMECTCPKNRSQNRYCEHMVALMIHIDREMPELLAQLDTRMPMRPPVKVRKKRTLADELSKNEPEETPATAITKDFGAAEKILDHLKGSIHSANLLAHGPMMRIRLEMKQGQLTHYDLDLDAAAKFLQSHAELKNLSSEVKNLRVFEDEAILGTRIIETEPEKILVERVIALPNKNQKSPDEKYQIIESIESRGELSGFEFVPIKSATKNLGKEFFYIPEKGYWPISFDHIKEEWHELPLKKVYKDDQAAELIRSKFSDYLSFGPIFLHQGLTEADVVEAQKISEIHVQERMGDGWFKLDPIYDLVKGSKISLIEMMRHFREKKRKFVKSGDKWIKIPDLVTENQWRFDDTGKFIEVDALGLLRLRASLGEFDQFVGSKHLLDQIRFQTEYNPDTEPPSLDHTKLSLRSYQLDGLKWLLWLQRNSLHGLLADEMGLGKTHQAMALLSAVQKDNENKNIQSKFLVVCPTTVLDHWEDKVHDFCPNLKPLKHHGAKRNQIQDSDFQDHSMVITSYGILMRDIRYFSKINFDVVILDEAHFAKNHDTATYQAVCKLSSRMRICLTGTPMENHLGELKNIFDFLLPGFFGSNEYFKKNFIQPINQNEKEKEVELQKLIYPFKMRRTKSNVLQDLPAKVEDIRHCTLSDDQVVLYKQVISQKATALVSQLKNDESPIPYMHVFATLSLLKQICDHPALISDQLSWKNLRSDKFELLKELLFEALESDQKVVIFSQYVGMIRIIEAYLNEESISHVVLTGQSKNRGQIIAKFQEDPSCKVFCGSLLAGGIGIDLTAASVVIHYDRWWNASKENQATDRVHRFGQNKNVQVLKLVTRGTLEEKIDLLIKKKQDLFEKFMDRDEELFKSFSRQDLIDLLQA